RFSLFLYNEHLLCLSSLLRSLLGIDCPILRSSGSLLRSLLCYRRPCRSCPCCSDACSCRRSPGRSCCTRLRSPGRSCCTRLRSSGRCSPRIRSPSGCCYRARFGSGCSRACTDACTRSPGRSRHGCPRCPPCLRCPRGRCCTHGCCCSGSCPHCSRPGCSRSRFRSFRFPRLFHRIEQGKEVGVRRDADSRLSIDCLYKFGEFHPPERITSK
ncbi:hypothetical protein PMAYCL1PPCAC_28608, partial [Pristionchus mayeri]